jgi:hypothetical protein
MKLVHQSYSHTLHSSLPLRGLCPDSVFMVAVGSLAAAEMRSDSLATRGSHAYHEEEEEGGGGGRGPEALCPRACVRPFTRARSVRVWQSVDPSGCAATACV